MITLIIGGSGSGKSAYAEEYAEMLSQGGRKYYLATMQVFDDEGQEKIARHRELRKDKDFVTIEQPVNIHKVLEGMVSETALLECMSNLVANEMFQGEVPTPCSDVTEKIIAEVKQLSCGLEQLVIVTNNVFEDGISYDESTKEYIEAMGQVNARLAAMADKVIEVVVGIPITIKEGN